MTIKWLGQSCFKINTKNNGQDTIIITDPYLGKFIGLKQPRYAADIVTVSHNHDDHNNYKDVKGTPNTPNPFIIKSPGEYEFKNIFVYGIPSWHDKNEGKNRGSNTMYVISTENMTITHLGDLGQTELTAEQLEYIENTDILLVPVGGNYTIDAKQSAKLINQIEPHIIIPMHYKIPGLKVDIKDHKDFLKEMGNNAEELDKLRISKKDLPQEQTKLIVLKP